jgi:hypothetical protein
MRRKFSAEENCSCSWRIKRSKSYSWNL